MIRNSEEDDIPAELALELQSKMWRIIGSDSREITPREWDGGSGASPFVADAGQQALSVDLVPESGVSDGRDIREQPVPSDVKSEEGSDGDEFGEFSSFK